MRSIRFAVLSNARKYVTERVVKNGRNDLFSVSLASDSCGYHASTNSAVIVMIIIQHDYQKVNNYLYFYLQIIAEIVNGTAWHQMSENSSKVSILGLLRGTAYIRKSKNI